MDPSPQLVRTGPRRARPRNLAIGYLGLPVVVAAPALCGRGILEIDEGSRPTTEATEAAP